MCNCKTKCGCNIAQTTKGEKGDSGLTIMPSYKVYSALLSQSGTNPPVDTILENTLGVTPTWHYDNQGNYHVEALGVFTLGKTVIVPGVINFDSLHNSTVPTVDNLYIETIAGGLAPGPDDGLLNNTFIEIRVYN
jgi:hypothetical protein